MRFAWDFTVFSDTNKRSEMAGMVCPWASSGKMSRSRGVRPYRSAKEAQRVASTSSGVGATSIEGADSPPERAGA